MDDKMTQALKSVIDPEIGINIVDLGLVYQVQMQEEPSKAILVTMTLTTPGCPMSSTITNGVRQILRAYYPEYEPEVELVWEPAWHPGQITEDGRTQMGM